MVFFSLILGLTPEWPKYASCLEVTRLENESVEITFNGKPKEFVTEQSNVMELQKFEQQIQHGMSFQDQYESIYRFQKNWKL